MRTENLELRRVGADEARRIVGGTPDESDAWAEGFPREDDVDGLKGKLDGLEGKNDTGPFGVLLISYLATGEAIGTIGFYRPPDEQGQVTIGYGLVEQYRGKGLGTEALRALIGYCRDQAGVTSILADTDLDNGASQRVLDKAGFTFTHSDDELRYYKLTL
jgi:RimJ/RimL family protein N-acetyltransferase